MIKKLKILIATMCIMSVNASAQSVTWGDDSRMDSLSYAVGVNTAMGMSRSMKYLPFDYDMFDKAAGNMALGVATLEENEYTMTPEEAQKILKDYFGTKYQTRLKAAQAAADTLKGDDKDDFIRWKLFETEVERKRVSKAYGMDFGRWLGKNGMPIEVCWVLKGMQEQRAGNAKMDNAAVEHHIRYYMNVTRHEVMKKQSSQWLSSVVQQPGVKALPSGLLYKVEQTGDANIRPVNDSDKVTVLYKGSKQNGDVFDESKEPISFKLNQVIKGWTDGMKLIGKGGKITLWVPWNLAYGERGAGNAIAPYEALRFDIELIDVQPQ